MFDGFTDTMARLRWRGIVLAGAAIFASVLVAACEGDRAGTIEPSGTLTPATSTSVPTLTPTGTPTELPSQTPVPTATPVPTQTSTVVAAIDAIRVESLICERFFPGVPNPDGPNEWLNVSGSLVNSGVSTIKLPAEAEPIKIDVLDRSGESVLSLVPRLDKATIEPGQTITFDIPPVNREYPTASVCTLGVVPEGSLSEFKVEGGLTVEITILAAP